MDREIRQRLGWVKLYEETGNAGLVCRRCGISRPTLRKWWRRYQEAGEDGLRSQCAVARCLTMLSTRATFRSGNLPDYSGSDYDFWVVGTPLLLSKSPIDLHALH